MGVLLLGILAGLAACTHSKSIVPSAVTLFRDNADELKMYAAVLAATEPLRSQRDAVIKKYLNPFLKLLMTVQGQTLGEYAEKIRDRNDDVDNALCTYESIAEDIIKNYGLTVSTFNEISKYVSGKPSMRQKVLLQAYYFRLAAELRSSLDKLPIISSDEEPPRMAKDMDYPPSQTQQRDSIVDDSVLNTFERFCLALNTIEQERISVRNDLQTTLRCDTLPDRMCEPSYLPAMNKQVQLACEKFPKMAYDVCKELDVDYEYFCATSDKMKTDPILRFRVRRVLDKIAASKDD